jgi:2-methylfumaryl-CoA hydratase
MVNKKDPSQSTGENSIPNLPEEIDLDETPADEGLRLDQFESRSTGGRWFYDDYEIGERVHHDCGMTLEEAEHQMATRLYQNTAKVHFDLQMMRNTPAGKRLIYGGHIISIARAMSFNGFENALRILGWNGGTHANPTFAGDTLYAFTDVLAKHEFPGRSDRGALRLRLVAVKNQDPQNEPLEIKAIDEKKGRETYHANVVLDLDYYVVMPKQ